MAKTTSSITIKSVWQFRPENNTGQPDFAAVQQALGGVRAVCRPPAPKEGTNVLLMLHPGDWLIELSNGIYTKVDAHAAYALFGLDRPDAKPRDMSGMDLPRVH